MQLRKQAKNAELMIIWGILRNSLLNIVQRNYYSKMLQRK